MSRGSETLNKAVTVKLTRPLAIVPITLGLSLIMAKKSAKEDVKTAKFSLKRAFPMFILYFVIAAIVTTLSIHMGVSAEVFQPIKELSKFMIIMENKNKDSNILETMPVGPLFIKMAVVASISILNSVMQFVMLLLPGLVQGAQPISSYNNTK